MPGILPLVQDAEARERLGLLFDFVDGWSSRRQRVPNVQAGSRTDHDDAATAPYQLSHLVLACLGGALDHLQALRALVVDARLLHASAPFTLIRGAIEGSAQVLWLLSPELRETRVERRLQLAAKDAGERDEAGALIGEVRLGDQLLSSRLQRLGDIAERAGVARQRALQRPLGIGRMVAAAEEAMSSPERMQLEFLWRLCSGYAHGQPWSLLAAGAQELVPGSQVGDVSQYVITADVSTVWMTASASVGMFRQALSLHDRHRLRWLGSPAT